jgi:integrase
LLAKRQKEIYDGRHFPDKKRTDLTMVKLRDLWLEHARHKRSIKNDVTRFRAIVDFFGADCLVATLSKQDVERFRDDLSRRTTRRGRKMAPATVNRHLALLRSALRNVMGEYLHRNPMQGVKFLAERNKRERECEPAEYERLLANADPDLHLAIVLAYEAGLRRVEVCGVRREHVNLKRREILIPVESSKTDSSRVVPLTKKAVAEIKAAPTRIDGLLVGLDLDEVSRGFRKLCADAGIRHLTFHDLRGTAITRLARAGASLDELQRFSGHKSVQALMKYLKRGDKRLRKLVAAMEGEGA